MNLRDILSLKRPTRQPEHWLPEVLTWLPTPHTLYVDKTESVMAIAHAVGPNAGDTLFCCHLDTVHPRAGYQTVSERRVSDPERGHGVQWRTSDGECLGADDGAGIWLMLEMIAAGVPGTYLFHLGEENGCIGSFWMAVEQEDWLQGFSRCMGLDRPGTTDVVTHFTGIPGCSQAFAEQLSRDLTNEMQGRVLRPCAKGGVTDVIWYLTIIPECTNISVGYHGQHTPEEWLDPDYLYALRAAMIAVFR